VGIYDSSRTRIAPVFGRLQCLDPSGRLWLQGLLELGNSRKLTTPQAGTAALRVAKWWPREARLAAPPGLLRWLLENVEKPRNASAWGRRPEVKENRQRVVDRDAATLADAFKRLRERRGSGRAWYVLEGPSQPDVYLDTGEVVVVIEGKRTEPGPTTSTAWMRVRHQMLRHLDGAWEFRQGRRLYGLFTVEVEKTRSRWHRHPFGSRRLTRRSPTRYFGAVCPTAHQTNDPRSPMPCSGLLPGRLCARNLRSHPRCSYRRSSMIGLSRAPRADDPAAPSNHRACRRG
jgi:hypothetical protein